MSNIIIGKHTLESLTSGMYSDSYVVYREYIQNSVDSIDEAIREGILEKGSEQIVVQLAPTENRIVITDNGIGIASDNVEKTLVSIGNSKKTSEASRGFRGIGRLAALSYCQRLTFSTSYKGEKIATKIIIDALKLSEILADESKSDVTVVDVLKSVYTVSSYEEREDAHYFTVQMDGVDSNTKLLSLVDVEDYLMQNAPVPYSPNFIWGKEIVKRLKKEGLEVGIYNICIEYGNKNIRIYKPYKDEFVVDKGKNIVDTVQDITIVKILNDYKQCIALGWLAKTNYMGSIYDKTIKGIRIRKGNILIGDHQTLNVVFKDARFNGWSIGEIYAVDKQLVPNARRDNFEKNSTYFSMIEQLMIVAIGITKDIRAASLKRNSVLSKAIDQVGSTSQQVMTAINEGISGNQKGIISKKLNDVRNAVSSSIATSNDEEYYQEIAFAELDLLIGKLKGTTKYKAINIIDNLTNTEKKILERVVQTVDSLNLECSDLVIDAILNNFSTK